MRSLERPSIQALSLALAVFAVYAVGACRTIYVGDSGELVAAAATLGIAHPSGYPLYVLLGHLWIAVVPFASVAFSMSLFSAFFGAAACGLLYATLRRHDAGAIAATLGALALAFAPSFWSQATVQRVYTLNGFFVVAVLACALEWHRSRRIGWMVAAALLAGLGAANHTVMGIVGVAVGVFAILLEPALLRRPRHLAACVGAGIAGLSPYLYMPLRSRQDPRLDWADPETPSALWAAMTRRDFWDRAWIEGPFDTLVILGDFLSGVGEETLWGGAVLALVGLFLARRFQWPPLLPVLVIVANLIVVGLHGSRTDIFVWHRYYIPAWVMLAVLAAWGTHALVERWGNKVTVVLLIPLALMITGWQRYDRSDFHVADDFSRKLLAQLPPGANLAASDDNILFVLTYLHLVEGVRPDINLILQGVGGDNLEALRFDPDDDPLFFTHHPNWQIRSLDVEPIGLSFQIRRVNSPPVELSLPEEELEGAWDPRVPKDYLTQNLIGHYHYMLGITHERRDWPRARQEFLRAVEAAPNNDVLLYNLGLIYRRNGMYDRALEAFERSAEINPRRLASNNEVRAVDRVEELRPEVERLASLRGELNTESKAAILEAAQRLEQAGEAAAARGLRLRAHEVE